MNTSTPSELGQDLLAEMAKIPVIIPGKLCKRRGSHGRINGWKLQRWHQGRNQTRYVPTEQLEKIREGSAGYERFMSLVQQYVEMKGREAMTATADSKKKAHEAVEAWAQDLHRFVEMAGQSLLRGGVGDIRWLETGLRETSTRACRDIVQGLLSLPGLRIPGDERRSGERRVGDVPRTVHTLFGDIELTRNWYKSSQAEGGRFPLDEALGLVEGYTPALAGLICRGAARQAFEQASEDFKAYTGLDVDARQFQRLGLRVGQMVERFLRTDHGLGTQAPPRAYVMIDGTGAPLRHLELVGRQGKGVDGKAQTHEVKVAALFTEHPRGGQDPWRDRDSTTYVATDERCDSFGEMVRAEYRRRFAGQPETVALGDGAPWIWELFRVQFPWAEQIVDFHHAAEHIGTLAELAYPRDSLPWRRLRRKWTAKLWNGKLDALFISAQAAVPVRKRKALKKALGYFEDNRIRMRYDLFRARGFFIGSGVVEAACKTLVCQRFKCSGMHWSRRGLKHLLAIRTALLSRRYADFWNWRSSKLSLAAA